MWGAARRYTTYFGALLSGAARLNSRPVFLHHVLLPPLPLFQPGERPALPPRPQTRPQTNRNPNSTPSNPPPPKIHPPPHPHLLPPPPDFQPFLKLYQALQLVHTSGV